jgi:molybdopterin/thiamine biosynthesis adenylyltransferase
VVVVGVGSVGSQVAEELANYVGCLRLFDGKQLQEHHLPRHALRKAYVGENKAVGMEEYLLQEIPNLQLDARPWQITSSLADKILDSYLHDASLIVAATDNREVQRKIGRRALALDIPAVFPGLYERNGGEVYLQLSPERPCFLCRDHFRSPNQELRGVAATNPDIMTIITLTNWISLAVLDPSASYRRLLAPERNQRWPPQLFVHNDLVLGKHIVPWHQGCPSCAVGPSSLRQEASEAWLAAEQARQATRSEPTQRAAIPLRSRHGSTRTWRLGWTTAGAMMVTLVLIAILLSSSGSRKPSVEISLAYKLKVHYGRSLDSMVKEAHLKEYKNDPPITEKLFPIKRGPAEVSASLVRFPYLKPHLNPETNEGGSKTYTWWLTKLKELRYRPATLPELLAFREQYPGQRSSPVIALGSLAPYPYGGNTLYCSIAMNYLILNLASDSASTSGSEYQFLAVHE